MTALVLACAAALPAAAACSAGSTPLCDRAAAQVQKAQLGAAAASYAEAERKKEGSCAADGLDQVSGKQASAIAEAAQGQAAENAGDLTTARSHYQAAIAVDSGNGQAAAGLLRVTRRPTDIGPLWLRAQRLHDEGLDDAARDEIVAVLKAHPDQVVPQSLTTLADPRPQPARDRQPAPVAEPRGQDPLGTWLTWSFLAAALLLAGALYTMTLLHARNRQKYEAGFADVGAKLNVLSHDLARAERRRAGGESGLRTAIDAQRTDADRLLLGLQPEPDTETCAYFAPDPPIAPAAGQTTLTDIRIYQAGEYLLLRRISSAVPDADLDWLAAALVGGDPADLRLVFGAELTERTFDPEWTGRPGYRGCPVPGSLTALLAELADGQGRWRPLVFGEPELPAGVLAPVPPSALAEPPVRIVQVTAILTGEQAPIYLCLRSLPQSLLAQAAARGVQAAFGGELSAAAAAESALSLDAARDAHDRERELLAADLARFAEPVRPVSPAVAQPPRPVTGPPAAADHAVAGGDPGQNGHTAPAPGEHRLTVIRNGPTMRVEHHDPTADGGDPGHFVKADYPS